MSTDPAAAPDAGGNFRVVTYYSLLLLVASLAVGFVLGAARHLLGGGAEHHWGTWDVTLVLRLIGTLTVCFAIYWRLARRHPHGFLGNGVVTAALAGAFSFLCSLTSAPNAPIAGLIVSVVSHIVIFLLSAAILRIVFRLPATKVASVRDQ